METGDGNGADFYTTLGNIVHGEFGALSTKRLTGIETRKRAGDKIPELPKAHSAPGGGPSVTLNLQ